jgi:hypothetical protein
MTTYEGVSKSFRTGRLEQKLQMIQLSATRCSCIAILWASLVSFAAITLCVAFQRVFIVVSVYFLMTQSGNFWIHPCSIESEVNDDLAFVWGGGERDELQVIIGQESQ